jgi:proteic killer suppression protein
VSLLDFLIKAVQANPGTLRKSTAAGDVGGASLTCDIIDVPRYAQPVIRSFGDRDTERLWNEERVRSIDPRTLRTALRKLEQLHAAKVVDDLRIPRGNRREALKGDRRGQHSVRINDQWRICFIWKDGGDDDVELVDCH